MIDYQRMQKEGPKLKAALTRAKNKQGAHDRYRAVVKACTDAVKVWSEVGAWPASSSVRCHSDQLSAIAAGVRCFRRLEHLENRY